MTELAVVALLCRTSDRTPAARAAPTALAEELGAAARRRARGWSGRPASRAPRGWQEDLRDSRGCILEAGGQVEDALASGRFPILLRVGLHDLA